LNALKKRDPQQYEELIKIIEQNWESFVKKCEKKKQTLVGKKKWDWKAEEKKSEDAESKSSQSSKKKKKDKKDDM